MADLAGPGWRRPVRTRPRRSRSGRSTSPPGRDNSGFVGWLATELKRRLGTGVVVICGYHRDRGGVYDYWGLPLELRARAAEVLTDLRRPGDTG